MTHDNHEHHGWRGGWRGPRRFRVGIITLVFFFLGAYIVGTNLIPSPVRTITVTATGTSTGSYNEAVFSAGVTNTASSSAAALATNTTEMNKLIAALSSGGITKADRQTSGLSVTNVTNSAGVTTGYQVTNSLTVTSHNVATVGALVGAVVSAVGNDVTIGSVSFQSSGNGDMAIARAHAMTQARLAATELLATSSDHAQLGAIESVTETPQSPTPVVFEGAALKTAASAASVSPGTQTWSDTVQVTYFIR